MSQPGLQARAAQPAACLTRANRNRCCREEDLEREEEAQLRAALAMSAQEYGAEQPWQQQQQPQEQQQQQRESSGAQPASPGAEEQRQLQRALELSAREMRSASAQQGCGGCGFELPCSPPRRGPGGGSPGVEVLDITADDPAAAAVRRAPEASSLLSLQVRAWTAAHCCLLTFLPSEELHCLPLTRACAPPKLQACIVEDDDPGVEGSSPGGAAAAPAGGGAAAAAGVEQPRYQLQAVVNHHGAAASCGHFSADVRGAGGAWHRHNDSLVSRIGGEEATGPKSQRDCYILCYAL